MAYRVEDWPIVPGSLNLMQPGDKLEKGDALQIQNFRVDQLGILKQRHGAAALNATGVANWIHSIGLLNQRRYYAAASSLYDLTRGLIEAGYSGNPLGLVPFQGWMWIMDTATGRRRKDNQSNVWNWTTETPGTVGTSAAGAGGALVAGDHDYYVTFTTDSAHESNPSAVKSQLVVANDLVTITRPARTEAVVTGWHAYVKRPSPGPQLLYRLNTTAIPYATATYDDYGDLAHFQDNESLQNHAILEQDHDAAPACSGLAGPYDGRLLAFNSSANPNRIWYTPALKPWYFPLDYYADVGDHYDPIYAISVFPKLAIVYKQRSIWRIEGPIEEGLIYQKIPTMGVVGPRAVARSGGQDFFRSKEGIYRFNGDTPPAKLSKKIEPVLRFEHVPIAYGISHVAANESDIAKTALGCRGNRLYCSIPSGSGPTTYPTYVCDLETERWARDTGQYWSYLEEGEGGDLLGGGYDHLFALEDGYADDGAAMELYFQTRYEDQGKPDRLKTYDDLVVWHNTQGRTVVLKAVVNNGQVTGDTLTLGTITSSAETRTVIRILNATAAVRAYNLAIRAECQTDAGQSLPVEIYSMVVHYFLEPRGAKSFDSDETDHGTPDAKWCDLVEMDIEAPDGQFTLKVYSDVPGGAMAERISNTKNATTGRQTVFVPIANGYLPYEGRLFRYTITSSYEFRLYGLRARIGRVGVLLDGAVANSVWQTREVSIGV